MLLRDLGGREDRSVAFSRSRGEQRDGFHRRLEYFLVELKQPPSEKKLKR